MPSFYQANAKIPEFDGIISGGVTVLFHSPDEVAGINDILRLDARGAQPLAIAYDLLARFGASLTWANATPPANADWRELSDELQGALALALQLWRQQDDPTTLYLAVSLAAPGQTLTISAEVPALVYHQGSIVATILSAPSRILAAGRWAIALLSSRGIGASQRAERMMEDFRTRELARPGAEILSRLDDLSPADLSGKSGVVLFLHGLLSIDIGLFDSFIRKLRPELPANCALIGWPHDTLTGIDTNASELRELVEYAIGLEGPPIAFVCHSRGGLLARSVAVKLFKRSPTWGAKVRGCLTFGTPHTGCPLAEAPDSVVAQVISLLATSKSHSFFSISDALWYTKNRGTVDGIRDLRPPGGGGDFIKDLRDSEADLAPPDRQRTLDIFAIGGKAAPIGVMRSFASRLLAGQDSDLVVEYRSSCPTVFGRTEATTCDHASYFAEWQAMQSHFDRAAAYVRDAFNVPPPPPPTPTPPPKLETNEDYVIIGGVRLPKNKKFKLNLKKPEKGTE